MLQKLLLELLLLFLLLHDALLGRLDPLLDLGDFGNRAEGDVAALASAPQVRRYGVEDGPFLV